MHLSALYALQCLATAEAIGVEEDVVMGITPTFPSPHREHLYLFALHQPPNSLVGRHPHDYYEPSVAMDLANYRPSRAHMLRSSLTYRS